MIPEDAIADLDRALHGSSSEGAVWGDLLNEVRALSGKDKDVEHDNVFRAPQAEYDRAAQDLPAS